MIIQMLDITTNNYSKDQLQVAFTVKTIVWNLYQSHLLPSDSHSCDESIGHDKMTYSMSQPHITVQHPTNGFTTDICGECLKDDNNA